MVKFDNWVFSRLAEPFDEKDVKWRVGGGRTFLAYIDARQVIERLNSVVGAENWHDEYSPLSFTDTSIKDVTNIHEVRQKIKEEGRSEDDVFWKFNNNINGLKDKSYAKYEYQDIFYGGVRCSLTVLGITKQDVGTPSMADQFKGAHSDALKRAAVKFGIGLYLYDLKNLEGGFAQKGIVTTPPKLPDWAIPVKRGDPDEALQALFEKAKSVKNINTIALENLFSEVSVMGSYNSALPLVVKRSVYERVESLIKEASQ